MRDVKKSEIETSIGFSRKWGARNAGQEAAETAIKKLKTPPTFFLLFSTIHYKKNGGFQDLLDGVWDVLPEGTPLIGGTVASFINNYGCYTRGVTALAVSYPNMDVSIGFGGHTKLVPKKAAIICAKMIKNNLKNSKYKNRILIDIISGPKVPISGLNYVKGKILGWLFTHVFIKLFNMLGYAWGKEEDIVDKLVDNMPGYYIIGGSSVDANQISENYQFVGKEVTTNSVIGLGIHCDLPVFLASKIGLHNTDKIFSITGTAYGSRIITKINDKPAKKQILETFGIIEEQFKDLGPFYYRTSNYFPITFEEDKRFTTGISAFFGDNVALGYKARGKTVRLLSITGKEILDVIDETFQDIGKNNLPFVFMSSSSIFMNTLGNKAYMIKNKLDEFLDETPYLMMCPINENAGTPQEPAIARVYSFNALSFGSNDRYR